LRTTPKRKKAAAPVYHLFFRCKNKNKKTPSVTIRLTASGTANGQNHLPSPLRVAIKYKNGNMEKLNPINEPNNLYLGKSEGEKVAQIIKRAPIGYSDQLSVLLME
jgi:hypothetical protein